MFTCKRLDNVQFGYKPKLIDDNFNQKDVFIAKVVDDSHYVPNSDIVRHSLSSGNFGTMQGVYDFPDGKDNGFNPKLRGLGFDPAEIDKAANEIVQEAKDKADSKVRADSDAKKSERANKILDNLANLSDSQESSEPQSE